MFSKFTRRWFVLDLESGYFYYLKGRMSKKPENTYPVTDIVSIDLHPTLKTLCDWNFPLTIKFTHREYFLYAFNLSTHHEWVRALGAIRTQHL